MVVLCHTNNATAGSTMSVADRIKAAKNTFELVDIFQKELVNDVKVKVAGIDIDGILRGKVISKEKFLSSVKSGGFGFCSVVFGWDMHDKTYSSNGGEQSYSDVLARIDLTSFRRIPWESNLPFFLVEFVDIHSVTKPMPMCPRGLLKSVTERFGNHGWIPTAGIEFEFFNFLESPETLREKKFMDLKPLTPGMFGYSLLRPSMAQDYFDSIFDNCLHFGIDIEGLHTETGPGVYEVALRYGDAITVADSAQLFKTSVKQIGQLRSTLSNLPSIWPSFMAKPSATLPGCSGHVHLSLMSKEGKNLFYDETDDYNMSTLMRHFIAGILKVLPAMMSIYAPTINSYKRLVENYWAPIRVCWGFENRSAAVRVITPKTTGTSACSPQGTRVELRVPGADINSHLAISAAFASGLYGIEKRLSLPEPVADAGEKSGERLPRTLEEAILRMDKSEETKEILGVEFVLHWLKTRREEWEKWSRAVTQYELERYFELV